MKYLITTLLFQAILWASAQTKTFIGLKGGANFSSVYFERTLSNAFINTDFIPGYNGGLVVRHFTRVNESSFVNAGLQTGICLTRKGWKQVFDTSEPAFATRLTYLEFPAEAFIYMGHANTKPFFTMGFYLEHLIKIDEDEDPDLENIGLAEFIPYDKSDFRTFGYGLRLAMGIQYQFKSGAIQAEGFATYSFRDIIEYETFDNEKPDLSNNYVLGFSLTYFMSFGKLDF